MSKNWFPVINEEKCARCMVCVEECKHGVYEASKDGEEPLIVHPENCIDGCRYCQTKVCEFDAITYYGDKNRQVKPRCTCGS